MTNEERIRELLETDLPHLLITHDENEDGDEVYITSDGFTFSEYDDAVSHELFWLSQECED